MNREAYGKFAGVYDRLMQDVDYDGWAGYLAALLLETGVASGSVLDCGCGTGQFSVRLAAANYRVIGLDLSPDMLGIAGENARKRGLSIPFVCQDMRHIRLHRPVDALVCACDGVNYLTSIRDVRLFFASAFAALDPGGVLLFDISSRYKLSAILGNTVLCEDGAECAYLWQNAYDEAAHLLEMRLSFFNQLPHGLYERFDERHVQRAHSKTEIKNALKAAGFADVRCYEAFTSKAPEKTAERLQWVARRPVAQVL